MSAQQAAGGQADGAAYTEQVYHSADPEGREHTMQLHTAQQVASDNGGSEATTLLNSGSEETTLLNSGSSTVETAAQRHKEMPDSEKQLY